MGPASNFNTSRWNRKRKNKKCLKIYPFISNISKNTFTSITYKICFWHWSGLFTFHPKDYLVYKESLDWHKWSLVYPSLIHWRLFGAFYLSFKEVLWRTWRKRKKRNILLVNPSQSQNLCLHFFNVANLYRVRTSILRWSPYLSDISGKKV